MKITQWKSAGGLALGLSLALASVAGAASFVSFQAGDLRVGSGLGASTDGLLVNSGYTTAATLLRSDQPDVPQNASHLLVGCSNEPVYRALLAFDVSYLTNIIGTNVLRLDMAALRLAHEANSGAGNSCCSTHGVYTSSPFDEATATWNAPHGPGSTPGGTFAVDLRDRSVSVVSATTEVETWGCPASFWGTDGGSGPDLLVDAVRTALTNSNHTLYLLVKRNSELTNRYYAEYIDDEDARVDLRPELLVGVDSIASVAPIVCFEDHFNQIDPAIWSIASSRPNVSVSNGVMALTTVAVGTNWQEGFISTPVYAAKYGYYETRMKVNDADGLNNAFWLNSPGEISGANNPVDRFEIDITEAHHEHNDSHMNVHDWAPVHTSSGAIVSIPDISADYHLVALDWRTDNSLVWYWDGQVKRTLSASSALAYNTMIPLAVLFSTKVIPYAGTPGPGLDGSQMLVDYVRVTQKPGWNGALSGNWSSASNWGLDGVPGTGLAAVFNQPAGNTAISFGADTFCHSLYFDNPGCPAFVFNSGNVSLHLGSASAGVGGITMNTTVTNSQTINVNLVADRQLQFGNFSRSLAATLYLNGNITAASSNTTIQLCGFAPVEVSGAFSSKIGRVLKWAANTVRLEGTNAHTGVTEIENGALVVGSPLALGSTSAGTVVSNGATLAFASGVQYSASEPLSLDGDGAVDWNGAVDLEGSGTASFGGAIQLLGDVTLGGGAAGGTLILSGNFNGTNSVQKNGNGLLVLGGSNSFVGLTINAGTVLSSNNNSLGAPTGSVFIDQLAQLRMAGNITNGNPVQLQGALPGTIQLLNTSGTNALANSIALLGGGFDYGIAVDSGLLTVAGGVAFTDVYTGTRTLHLSGSSRGQIRGSIRDGASAVVAISKEGAGEWTLAGTNSYTAATAVGAGLLRIEGVCASPVTVSGGALSGSGVISNKVTVSLGIHAPTGIQTVWSNYVVSAGGALKIAINGSSAGLEFSQVATRGGNASVVTLAGTLMVSARPGLATNSTYVIIDNDGTDPIGGTFSGLPNNATFFQSGYTWRISYIGGSGNDVTLTAVAAIQPKVEFDRVAGACALSWPDWASAYSLYTTTNLATPAVWSAVTNVPVLTNGAFRIELPASLEISRFYRLMWP